MYRPLSSGPIQYKSTHHPSAARPERPKNHSSGEEKDRINYWSCLSLFCAPVAQLDRALASEARGRVFESRRAHHLLTPSTKRGNRLTAVDCPPRGQLFQPLNHTCYHDVDEVSNHTPPNF